MSENVDVLRHAVEVAWAHRNAPNGGNELLGDTVRAAVTRAESALAEAPPAYGTERWAFREFVTTYIDYVNGKRLMYGSEVINALDACRPYLPEPKQMGAIVWVVTNSQTFPESAVIAVFSDENQARRFAEKRNTEGAPIFYVHRQTIDEWAVNG